MAILKAPTARKFLLHFCLACAILDLIPLCIRKRGGFTLKKIFSSVFQYLRRLDKILLLLTVFICAFSVVLLYSLVQNNMTQNITSVDTTLDYTDYRNQALAALMGIVFSLAVAAWDYRKFSKLWFIYLPLMVGLTCLTFTSLGESGLEGADDRAWISIGGFSLQPSEFLKLAFILSFAYHCHKTKDVFNNPLNVLALCVHGAVPIGLVMLQGDDGTAIVFAAIFIAMLFAAGIGWQYILGAGILSPIAIYFIWTYYLQDVHKNRILAILNPAKYATKDMLYQTNLSKIALGSGQLMGKGLFGGDYSYVPVCHNDFIFSYVGQTLGFIGCLGLIILICAICVKILINSLRSADPLGRYICVGVFAYIFAQSVLNIGMVIGVTPVIGITLPFVSAGGSSMLSATASVGLVMSVYYHSAKFDTIFAKKK